MVDVVLFATVYSLVLLALGSWCIREGADILSDHYEGSVVASLIVALLNSAPEVIFFVTALSANRDPSFAIGALSGSVIIECTASLGLGIFLASIKTRSNSFTLDKSVRALGQVLTLTTPLLICIIVDGFCLSFGLLGASGYIGFLWFTISGSSSRSSKKHQDLSDGSNRDGEDAPKGKGYLFTLIGLLIFVLFTDDFINATSLHAKDHHYCPMFLAFFLGPIATSTPALLDCFTLAASGKRETLIAAVSNIMTSVICKTTLVTGILCLAGYFKSSPLLPSYSVHFIAIALTVAIAGSIVSIPASLSRNHGLALLGLFLVGVVWQFRGSDSASTLIYNQKSFARVATNLVANNNPSTATSTLTPQFRDILEEINLTPYSS